MTTQLRTTPTVEHACNDNLTRDKFHIVGIQDALGNVYWGLRAVDYIGNQAPELSQLRAVKFCPWCGEQFPQGAHPPEAVAPFVPKPWNQKVLPEGEAQ